MCVVRPHVGVRDQQWICVCLDSQSVYLANTQRYLAVTSFSLMSPEACMDFRVSHVHCSASILIWQVTGQSWTSRTQLYLGWPTVSHAVKHVSAI